MALASVSQSEETRGNLKVVFTRYLAVLFAFTVVLPGQQPPPKEAPQDVTRATLKNGMRVVLVRNRLAPVASIHLAYLAGGDETPPGFPGTAHAQEHMAFRGCQGLTADQIAAIYAQLGGQMNAETQQNNTQYFVTVPAQDLDVALRIYSACMTDVEDSQTQWSSERGAIEQEVSRDLSNPTYKLLTRLNENLFAGTPYEHDPLGSKESFDKTTGTMLHDFFTTWYTPNNAILVIVGDFDPAGTMAKVEGYFGSLPARKLPEREGVTLQPVKTGSFTLDSNLPYLLATLTFRFPGAESPDYAASRVLADVIASQRGPLYQLAVDGKALQAGFAPLASYPKAGAALAYAVLPTGADPAPLLKETRGILAGFSNNGVPADLVKASIKGAIAGAEFDRNSISGLGRAWTEALAAEGRNSPSDNVEAIRKVTVADVNRVARRYLTEANMIEAILKPTQSGEAAASKGFGGEEKTVSPPSKPVALPDWAEGAVKSLSVPDVHLHPVEYKLANGVRLIVQQESISPTVTLSGSVKTQNEMQTPPGKDGLPDLVESLFNYGTKNRDRLTFQKELDDIAASVSAGSSFGLKALKTEFGHALELLADNELHPAFPEEAFKIVQKQLADAAEGERQSPGYRFERALTRALLPAKDPLQREATAQTITALTYEDVQTYYRRIYRPDLATIVVVGDIAPADARAAVERYFGQWKAPGGEEKVDLPAVPANAPGAFNVPDPAQVQDSVVLALQLEMNRFSSDFYPLQVGDHVLGGGFYATRLDRDLRQQAGLVYSIDNSLDAGQSRASYSVQFGCDPDKVSKARGLVEGELRAMRTHDVAPAELQQAKALLLRQLPLGEASEDAIAAGYIRRARVGLPLDEPKNAAKRYFEMTAPEIRAAFTHHIDPARFVQVVRGPAPQ